MKINLYEVLVFLFTITYTIFYKIKLTNITLCFQIVTTYCLRLVVFNQAMQAFHRSAEEAREEARRNGYAFSSAESTALEDEEEATSSNESEGNFSNKSIACIC